jgi:hypothetical protein
MTETPSPIETEQRELVVAAAITPEERRQLVAEMTAGLAQGMKSAVLSINAILAYEAALEEAEAQSGKLIEYAKAAADDYDGMCAAIREAAMETHMPKSLMDAAESASLLRRAAAGDDVFAHYQAELSIQARRAALAEAALSTLQQENERLRGLLDEAWTMANEAVQAAGCAFVGFAALETRVLSALYPLPSQGGEDHVG